MTICDVCSARLHPRVGITLRDEGMTVSCNGLTAKLGPARYEIVAALVTAYPRPLSLGTLSDAIYYRTPDDERPQNEANLLRVLIHHTRKQLAAIGLDITRVGAGLYALEVLI